jgi:hypothetical protein
VERTMKLMVGMMVSGFLAGCGGSSTVVGPSGIPGPGPAGSPGPGPNIESDVDVPGSGILATESRDVSGFSRVTLAGVGHLIIEHGAVEALEISADDNILPLFTAEVYGDELVIGTVGKTFSSAHKPVFRLTVAELDALSVTGAAAAEVRGLDTQRFAIRIDGAAAVTAAGRADEQDVFISGVASYDARALDARAVHLDVSGVCGVMVRAREILDGWVGGQSTVEYLGSPTVNVNVTEGGAVSPAGE